MSNYTLSLAALGQQMVELSTNNSDPDFINQLRLAEQENKWFTQDSILFALKSIGESLDINKLNQWLAPYHLEQNNKAKTVGLILAGNLPLVGFHDILCVLISGNKALVKLSSKDTVLYHYIKKLLTQIDPELANKLIYTKDQLKEMDAIVATGSDNSARYFEYYFKKYPHIIRRNRNSVAIITGEESAEEFHKLGKDIFTYFGLGCRNVSHILIPEGFDITKLIDGLEKHQEVINNNKYANNYDYQKAILALNLLPHYDNGFLIFKPALELSSPIGSVNYSTYKTPEDVEQFYKTNENNIQCVLSRTKWNFPTFALGEAQNPQLWDYADNVDTLAFLKNIN